MYIYLHIKQTHSLGYNFTKIILTLLFDKILIVIIKITSDCYSTKQNIKLFNILIIKS